MDIWREIKDSFKYGHVVTRLIYINLAVFLVYNLLDVFLYLLANGARADFLVPYIAVPAHIENLMAHPWTVFTYMFFHKDFLHILFNLVWFYWFGKIFLEYLTSRQLLGVYMLGGLTGALLYILSFNLFPAFHDILPGSVALGASASVLAVVIAIAVYVPDYTIFLLFLGPVKLKYIALFSIAIDIISIPAGNAGGHIAHLGGAFFGYVFIILLRKRIDLTRIFNTGQWQNPFRRKPKFKVHGTVPRDDYQYHAQKNASQAEIDHILDKIARAGYDSLSADEKETLFKMSRKN